MVTPADDLQFSKEKSPNNPTVLRTDVAPQVGRARYRPFSMHGYMNGGHFGVSR